MNTVVAQITDVFDQLNPFNTGNLIVYFSWTMIFGFTLVGVVRARHGFTRFLCYVVNQAFSIGIILSWTLTALLAYTYWWQSLSVLAGALLIGLLVFRGERRAVFNHI